MQDDSLGTFRKGFQHHWAPPTYLHLPSTSLTHHLPNVFNYTLSYSRLRAWMPQVFSSRSPRLGKPERFSTSPACQRAGKEKPLREPNHLPLTAYFQECGMPSVVPSYLRLVIEMLSSQEQVHSRDHSAQPQRSFPSVLNQHLPSLLPPPPWLKPRCPLECRAKQPPSYE